MSIRTSHKASIIMSLSISLMTISTAHAEQYCKSVDKDGNATYTLAPDKGCNAKKMKTVAISHHITPNSSPAKTDSATTPPNTSAATATSSSPTATTTSTPTTSATSSTPAAITSTPAATTTSIPVAAIHAPVAAEPSTSNVPR